MCPCVSRLYWFCGHFSSTYKHFMFEMLHNWMFPIWNVNTLHEEKEVKVIKKKKKSNNISLTPMSVAPISYMNFPSAFTKEYVNSCILQEDNLMQPAETVKHLVISWYQLHYCCRCQVTLGLPASFVQTLLKKIATVLLSLSEISLPIDLSSLYILLNVHWIRQQNTVCLEIYGLHSL